MDEKSKEKIAKDDSQEASALAATSSATKTKELANEAAPKELVDTSKKPALPVDSGDANEIAKRTDLKQAMAPPVDSDRVMELAKRRELAMFPGTSSTSLATAHAAANCRNGNLDTGSAKKSTMTDTVSATSSHLGAQAVPGINESTHVMDTGQSEDSFIIHESSTNERGAATHPGAQAVPGINERTHVMDTAQSEDSFIIHESSTNERGAATESLVSAELVDEENLHDRLSRNMSVYQASAVSYRQSDDNFIDTAFKIACCCFPKLHDTSSHTKKAFCLLVGGMIVIGSIVALSVVVATSKESTEPSTESHIHTDKTALLMIDVQDCFMNDESVTSSGQQGSLAVRDAAKIIPFINEIRKQRSCLFDINVRSQDFHPHLHISFGSTHGLEPFAHTFGKGGLPVTCVDLQAGSCCPTYHVEPGPHDCDSELCPSIENMTTEAFEHVLNSPACTICKNNPEDCFTTTQGMWPEHCLQDGDSTFPLSLYTEDSDIVFPKGDNDYVDAYSPFMDNTRRIRTSLDTLLKENNVKTLYVLGIAIDFGLRYTVAQALFLGYDTYVVLNASIGIAPATTDAAIAEMEAQGAVLINTADVLAMECHHN